MNNFYGFTDDELKGLQSPLPAMLAVAHKISDEAIAEATQGKIKEVAYRLTATVATDGHSSGSAHYKGLAVDIGLGHLAEGFARDTVRWAIMKGLYAAGFKRIEDCPLHIHADIGEPPDFASPCAWIGEDL